MSSILTNPLYRPLLEALRSARNGIVYGGKIRFSHALVINLLYRSGPILPRLKPVLKATKNHAEVLAAFAMIYKIAVKLLIQPTLLGPGNTRLAKFIGGAFGAWIVYSQHFPYFHPGITHQITLYCYSRVSLAVGKILLDYYLQSRQPMFRNSKGDVLLFNDLTSKQQLKLKNAIYGRSWKYFAVLVWALVMFIYDYQPQYLQSSLRHSMAYIYDVELDSWSSWWEFLGI
ncbi:Tim17/Tim22/Tim23/Pmp24 family-domain-containing protein [Scheffersomyces amazonensis]|uniref:Tim17/Tim22/Tim23/Pmp24 family-domain-containing protein n=1 Tax=Scheffersomyces amazonensis TaxID=1078765 RepID=UPI00315D42D6